MTVVTTKRGSKQDMEELLNKGYFGTNHFVSCIGRSKTLGGTNGVLYREALPLFEGHLSKITVCILLFGSAQYSGTPSNPVDALAEI